jgi:hypothetical protein
MVRVGWGGGDETEGTNKDVLEWTCAEVVRHLKERTDPPVNQSLLDGFDMQEINGATTATTRNTHHRTRTRRTRML